MKKYLYRKVLEAILLHGRHGNAEMHMHSECHLLALYSLQVVKKCLVPGCPGNGMLTKFHFRGLQV